MNERPGYTLAELVATMSVGTVLLGLATGAIHRTMRLESQSHERADVHRVSLRLSASFRRDVHRANDLRLDTEADQGVALHLSIPEAAEIVYRINGARVLRRQQLDKQPATEVFDFPDSYAIKITQPKAQQLALHVETDSESLTNPAQTVLRVTAEIGRLLRLARFEERQL